MAPPAEGPSVTKVTSETEEEVFNEDQPRANPHPKRYQEQTQTTRNSKFTTFTLDDLPH